MDNFTEREPRLWQEEVFNMAESKDQARILIEYGLEHGDLDDKSLIEICREKQLRMNAIESLKGYKL